MGEIGKAAEIFEEWLKEEPEDPIARHMLAACTGRDVPERASDGFVETTFDSFAASFESKLASLSYRAPALVAAMLEDAGLEPSQRLDVLDAGCGTGLCGPLVAPFARRLVGVDLSEGMLAHAKDKNVYHALIKAELTEYLRDEQRSLRPDRVGRYAGLFRRSQERHRGVRSARLRPNGLLVFTLEHAIGDHGGVGYRLRVARPLQSWPRPMSSELLTSAGLQSKIVEAELRMEAGAPVAGLVVRAEKP